MGYDTKFEGFISIEPSLNAAEVEYLTKFSETRRMHRHAGPYFVHGAGFRGQSGEDGVIDQNKAPVGQPGLWCQWIPTEDGTKLVWDGGEKFYASVEWMVYLIDHFLRCDGLASSNDMFKEFTFDHVCNGVIHAQGEESGDVWSLVVTNNLVMKIHGNITGMTAALAGE